MSEASHLGVQAYEAADYDAVKWSPGHPPDFIRAEGDWPVTLPSHVGATSASGSLVVFEAWIPVESGELHSYLAPRPCAPLAGRCTWPLRTGKSGCPSSGPTTAPRHLDHPDRLAFCSQGVMARRRHVLAEVHEFSYFQVGITIESFDELRRSADAPPLVVPERGEQPRLIGGRSRRQRSALGRCILPVGGLRRAASTNT